MVRMTERFGGWILDTRAGLIFGLTVLVLGGLLCFKLFFGSLVVLNAKEFECVLARPDGLGTRCIEFVLRGR